MRSKRAPFVVPYPGLLASVLQDARSFLVARGCARHSAFLYCILIIIVRNPSACLLDVWHDGFFRALGGWCCFDVVAVLSARARSHRPRGRLLLSRSVAFPPGDKTARYLVHEVVMIWLYPMLAPALTEAQQQRLHAQHTGV